MEGRRKKRTSHGPSSSRSTSISKRHLRSPEDDPRDIRDLRSRNVIVERQVDLNHITPYGLFPLLDSVGWSNILLWGGPAYKSIAQSMVACICNFSFENLTFDIDTSEGKFHVDRHLISGILDIPVNDEGIPIHTLYEKPSESEKQMLTRDLCKIDAQWSHKGNALPSKYLLPKFRVLHRIFISNLYPRSGNKTELTAFMVRILHSIVSSTQVCLPSLICHFIIYFRMHPGHSDIPFGYLFTVLANQMLVDIPDNEAPIHHLIFNNSNLNKMKLEFLPGQADGGVGDGGNEGGDADLPQQDDINMDDLFEDIETDSPNDPDFNPSGYDARLRALEEKVDNMSIAHDMQFKYMRKYLRRINKGLHQIDPTIPGPSSGSD